MSKRSRNINETTITRRIKEGRGQGHGVNYKPWLFIQDVSSHGLAQRVKGWKTERVHHLLSRLEQAYFYLLDWSPFIHDIREQFPLLPLEKTQAIADQCGIRHPIDSKTHQAVVMTTDFIVDVFQGGQRIEQARTVKRSADLKTKRTLEKLEIERLYWQEKGIDWGIVTEREIPKVYAENVRKLHGYKQIADRLPAEIDLNEVIGTLSSLVGGNALLTEVVQKGDATLGLPPGTTLTVAYHLLATRQWQADLSLALESRAMRVTLPEEVAL